MGKLLAFIPGIGPALSTLWTFRYLIAAVAIFWGGWEAKGRVDEAATVRATLAKTRIDLKAQTEAAEQAGIVIAELDASDRRNQETIRELQSRPIPAAPAAACRADDPIARKLRELR